MRVAVIGAGIAGLASAVAMRRRGHEVAIYERSIREETPNRPGHGLILMHNGHLALDLLGAGGFLDHHRALRQTVVQDQHGTVLRSESVESAYCLTRQAVVNALSSQLTETPIQHGHACVGAELDPAPSSEGTRGGLRRRVRTVTFRNGVRLSDSDVDLFVAADGSHSLLHAAMNNAEKRPTSPVLEIVTTTRLPALAEQLGSTFLKTVFVGRGMAYGLLSPCEDLVIGFLQFDSRRHGTPTVHEDLGVFVRRLIGNPPEPVANYLERADYSAGHLWRPLHAPMPKVLSAANAMLVGDAAHPLLPFSSQGAGAALEDAVILAAAVEGARTRPYLLPRILDGYARDRRADVAVYLVGGQRILSDFVGSSGASVLPYVDGANSKLAEHLRLPPADLLTLCQHFDQDRDDAFSRTEFDMATSAMLGRPFPRVDQRALFSHIDADRDDRITLEEFVRAFGEHDAPLPALDQLRTALTPRNISTMILAHAPNAALLP